MLDHIDNLDMTLEERSHQGRIDEQAARAFVGAYLAEHVDPAALATTLQVLEVIAQMPLDRLSARIETDSNGNPLYTYGNRMVCIKASDAAETADYTRALLSRAYLEHEANQNGERNV